MAIFLIIEYASFPFIVYSKLALYISLAFSEWLIEVEILKESEVTL